MDGLATLGGKFSTESHRITKSERKRNGRRQWDSDQLKSNIDRSCVADSNRPKPDGDTSNTYSCHNKVFAHQSLPEPILDDEEYWMRLAARLIQIKSEQADRSGIQFHFTDILGRVVEIL